MLSTTIEKDSHRARQDLRGVSNSRLQDGHRITMNDKANVDQDQDDVGTRPPDVRSPLDGMSAQDAAVRLGMSERTIRRAIARGELVAVKQGASFRIAAADLERYA